MGKKSKKTPGYASATYDTGGLFGSSTASKSGVTYNPESWMTDTMGTVQNNYNTTLQSMLNNDFRTDPNFQAYQNQFNKQMANNYDNTVLNNLANRGLMRSSGLQAANNAFADVMADKQLGVYDNYYNRLNSNLANLLNTSNTLYNYMMNTNSGAQNQANNVNNYAINRTAANNAATQQNNALYANLANTVANIGSAVT